MSLGGFAGTVLVVDLTDGVITREPLDPELARDFIGGLGLTVKLAYENLRPGTDALAPENPIVLGAGALVGTDLPATSRLFSITKLPTSGTIGWCGAGGVTFACMLKNAGYDHVVIKGKADRPVYLEIVDDQVALRDASALWGLGVGATCEAIWKDHGRPTGVLSIGQAGEKLARFSMAYVDRIATLGRGGFGAVMGAKNLKAVVARGTRGVSVSDRKGYKALRNEIFERMRTYPHLKEWQEMGLINSFPFVEKETYLNIKKRRVACVSCPIGCKDVVEIRDGEFKGEVVCSSSAINLFTPVIYGMKDYREAIKLIADLDEYGLDMFEFLGLMVFAKALADNGLIPRDEAEPKIAVESLASMQAWAGKIARREGLGDLLADGFPSLIEAFGERAEALAPALVKGMHPYAGPGAALPWHLFGTMELGQVLDPRGPHVGSSGSPTYFARRPLEVFPTHLDRMGLLEDEIAGLLPKGDEGDITGLRVGGLLRHSHRWFAILGSLGVCARAQINRFYSASFCARAYEAVTGIETSVSQLRERADRAWTLLRMANLREGFQREREEVLPRQWFGDRGFQDYVNDELLTITETEQMIDDYYREWNWDPKTGVPTQKALERLGLRWPGT
jgi:aldehyde:ferredoxin oxidoreductase